MWERKPWAIVLIWIAVLVAALTGAGFGTLATVVGVISTVIYLAITKPKPRSVAPRQAHPVRGCPTCGALMECDARICPSCGSESSPWIRHEDTWWFQSRSGAWQWLDENDGVWRWYEGGTPSTNAATSNAISSRALEPAAGNPSAPDEHGG